MLALQTADHTLTRPSGPCPHPCGIQRISSTANAQGLRGLAADMGGSPVCPVPSKNSAAVPHLAIFPMLFSCTFHKDISPDRYSKFRSPVCHVPSKNSAAVPHLAIFLTPFQYTFHKDSRPDCHSNFRAASCSPSRKFSVLKELRNCSSLAVFPRPFHFAFHGTVKSAGLHPSVQRPRERSHLERLHSTTSRNLMPVIGWVRCAVHATSPRPSLCDQKLCSDRFLSSFAPVSAGFGALFMPRHLDRVSVIRSWTVPDFCLVLHQ